MGDNGSTSTTPALELVGCSHTYGRVSALDGVDLQVYSGEIHCLLGDNGAGKSSVIKILSGDVIPTAGELRIAGRPEVMRSPRDAARHGIATVHQEVGIFPLMSIWRNFFLGEEVTHGWRPFKVLDAPRMRSITEAQVRSFGITGVNDPDQPAGALSGGQRQGIVIARALYFGASVLLLDEPTAALGVREARTVVEVLLRARKKGTAIVFITHNPRHALLAGDRFTVLRHGRTIASRHRDGMHYDELVELMGGEEISISDAED